MHDPHTVSDPDVLYGKPVVAGARVSVELIREELRAGLSVDDLMREYPHLGREQIDAVLFPSPAEDDDERPWRGMFTDLSGTTAPPGFQLPPEPPLPPARLPVPNLGWLPDREDENG